jgi:hypothetical protein
VRKVTAGGRDLLKPRKKEGTPANSMAGVPLYREASDSRPAAVDCQGDSMPRVSDARLATALVVWKARRVGQHRISFSNFQCFERVGASGIYSFPPPSRVSAFGVPASAAATF